MVQLPRSGLKDRVYASFQFGVEIDGLIGAVFNEVTGLEAKLDVEEYKEGGNNGHTWKVPGRLSYSTVTLKWGTQFAPGLQNWLKAFIEADNKKPLCRTIHIIQLDPSRREVHRWVLEDAFPVKWSGPQFNGASTALGSESLELAFSNMTFVQRPA
jgi:phage tail-like protein